MIKITRDSNLGKQRGLSLTRTRAYCSTLGRWLGRDSLAESQGTNLFRYVENCPVSDTDPSGQAPLWESTLENVTCV